MVPPLVPPPEFEYLSVEERAVLENAFLTADVEYDDSTRARLLDGINRRYARDFLSRITHIPADLLNADLRRLGRVERIWDGTVPLAQWLRNAVRRFQVLPERAVFESALIKVSGEGETGLTVAPEDAPPLNFEEIITDGIDDLQEGWFLSIGAQRLPAVAKLLVPKYENGRLVTLPGGNTPYLGAGTGWLIASDLLLTNYHVIRNRSQHQPGISDDDLLLQVQGAEALFFYDTEEDEGKRIPITRLVAVGKCKTEDFALLRLLEPPHVACLPVRDEELRLPEPERTPKGMIARASVVNIIQHPGGGPKRVALRNNLVYRVEYPKLHYFTDTLGGSSGSPVFDDTWHVVALHRGAVAARAEFHGRTLGYVNEGIQIHAILALLTEFAKSDEQVGRAMAQIRREQQGTRGD